MKILKLNIENEWKILRNRYYKRRENSAILSTNTFLFLKMKKILELKKYEQRHAIRKIKQAKVTRDYYSYRYQRK